jgi:hypothetical protein
MATFDSRSVPAPLGRISRELDSVPGSLIGRTRHPDRKISQQLKSQTQLELSLQTRAGVLGRGVVVVAVEVHRSGAPINILKECIEQQKTPE